MTFMNRRLVKNVLFWSCFLIVLPALYVGHLDVFVDHPGLKLSSTWNDYGFLCWNMITNAPVNGSISNVGGPLKITMNGPRSAGAIVAAQRTEDLPLEIPSDGYLKVSAKASSINVAVRIVIWTDFEHPQNVLVKTYNDNEWHVEVVSLPFFRLSGNISMIELSMMQLNNSTSDEWVLYKELSFCYLEL